MSISFVNDIARSKSYYPKHTRKGNVLHKTVQSLFNFGVRSDT